MFRWHDTDNNTIPRVYGVPVASTMWITVFEACFSWLMNISLPTEAKEKISSRTAIRISLTVILLSVPLMMIHMMVEQILFGRALPPQLPPPDMTMLLATLTAYLLFIGFHSTTFDISRIRYSKILFLIIFLYTSTLLFIGIRFAPENQVSIGVHQVYGPSDVTATDWSGLSRYVYLSAENMQHKDYFLIDTATTRDFSSWYKIQGIPHSDQWNKILGIVLSLVLFTYIGIPAVIRNISGDRKAK